MADGTIPAPIKPVSTSQDAVAKPRSYIGIDTETALSTDACACPALACLTWYVPGDDDAQIAGRLDAPRVFEGLLRFALETRTTIVAHHLPYDLSILANEAPHLIPLIFDVLDAGLFECTLLCDKLDDIARGQYDNEGKQRWHDLGAGRKPYTYGLADTMLIRTGIHLDKSADTWRTRYGELIDIPIAHWPEAARRYALDDAKAHWLLRMKQDADEAADPAGEGYYVFADAPAQTRAGLALALMRVKGIRTDPVHTARLKATLEGRMLEVIDELIRVGFLRKGYMRPRAKDWKPPSKDTKKIKAHIVATAARLGVDYKRVKDEDGNDKPDSVSMDKEALELLDDPALNSLRAYTSTQKLIGYTTILESGFHHAIHSEPNTLVANGRISWGSESPDGYGDDARSVNLTNLPTEPGVRECYVPRAGNLFWAVDYSTLELCTVAQACIWWLGRSRLAELINDGTDMHSLLGSMILNISYEDFIARRKAGDVLCELVRDLAKRANFGLWGGMGIDRFFSTCRDLAADLAKVGIILTRELIVHLKDTWRTMLPETWDYFKIANTIANGSQQVVQFTSDRLRGGLDYCDAANTPFSGMAADGGKEATYKIQRACFREPESPLFGSFMNAFIHDEFFGESPEEKAHAAAHEVERIARETMQARVPDVRIKCSISLMRRWRKGAKAFHVDGILRPHEESPSFKAALARGEVFA